MMFTIIPKISSTEIDRSSDGMKQRKPSKLQSEQSLENNEISDWPLRVLAENAIGIKDSQIKRQCITLQTSISRKSNTLRDKQRFRIRNFECIT